MSSGHHPNDGASDGGASITVIVPTYNRAGFLVELIDALKAQSHDDFVAILVDDGSTDDTMAVAHDAFNGDDRFKLISKQNEGPARARNMAGLAATTQWLAFTDDDCVPQPRWLEEMLAEARREQASVVQGRTLSDPSVNRRELPWFARGKTVLAWSGRFQTCNLMVRTSAFKAVGGFDQRFPPSAFGEDTDLGLRLVADGARTAYSAGAIVHHRVLVMSFPTYLKRRYRWSEVVRLVALNRAARATFRFRYVSSTDHLAWWFGLTIAIVALASGGWWIIPAGLAAHAIYRIHLTRSEGRSVLVRAARSPLDLVALIVESAGFLHKSIRYRTLLL